MDSSSINTRLNNLPTDDVNNFGLAVLRIMEANEEWDSDTLEEICAEARFYELSDSDGNGYFKVRDRD